MHRVRLRAGLGMTLMAVVAGAVHPAGYTLSEQGSRALGTAGAFTATADDPSAIYFNPAGIARLPGTRFYGGISPIVPRLEFEGTAPYPGYGVGERWRDKVLVPPHAYGTFALREGVVAGIGLHVPYGLESDWRSPDDFSGRYIATFAQVRGWYINPTLAAELTPSLSLGVGLDVVLADAKLVRRVPLFIFNGSETVLIDIAEATLDGDLTPNLTFNAGLLYDRGRFRFGLSYRHGVTNEIEGDATFTYIPTGDASFDSVLAASIPDNQRGTAVIPFPALVSTGVAVELGDRVTAEVNLNWTRWSVFDELPLTFDDPMLSSTRIQDYDDVFSVRTGIDFEASDKLSLRGGYYFDDTPAPTAAVGPILPDAERHGMTFGLGYRYERWQLDIFEMLLFFAEREVRDNRDNFNGNYSQRAWLSGISLGYAIW